MSLAEVFDRLGQEVIPLVTEAVFPDTMTITGETVTAGSGGGRIKSAALPVYTNVPCAYEPMQIETRRDSANRLLSLQQYMVTFPTHHPTSGARINIDPKAHTLRVNQRGNEPEKVFKITAVRDWMGVNFEAVCEKEN